MSHCSSLLEETLDRVLLWPESKKKYRGCATLIDMENIVSRHLKRRTAEEAKTRYERWQGIANGDLPPLSWQIQAQKHLDVHGLKIDTALTVVSRIGRYPWAVLADA
jgi:hypothetical protein